MAIRAQLEFLMAPEDEAEFLAMALERPTAYVIPQVRNPTAYVPRTRDAATLTSSQCMLWDSAVLAEPEVEYIPTCNDYYLRSDRALIQLLRSRQHPPAIGNGRIAAVTDDTACGKAAEVWFTSLVRFLKRHYDNHLVLASLERPEIGYPQSRYWAGPHAIALANAGTAQLNLESRGYHLVPYARADKANVLARYRPWHRRLCVGQVVETGPVLDAQTGKVQFTINLSADAPVRQVAGGFMTSRPVPVVGDSVACLISEAITADTWEPRELKKLTPSNSARVLAALRKSWRIS